MIYKILNSLRMREYKMDRMCEMLTFSNKKCRNTGIFGVNSLGKEVCHAHTAISLKRGLNVRPYNTIPKWEVLYTLEDLDRFSTAKGMYDDYYNMNNNGIDINPLHYGYSNEKISDSEEDDSFVEDDDIVEYESDCDEYEWEYCTSEKRAHK
ncbi:Hypothetical protein ORPV_775 [Orpheovirus IHUMI-LCC2]|uniref:Uncharacterized protein n=1 Tax=Orpheovirus IHUMI-LCC2 TaxID=2023057 RepID=A0A2I2L5E5_9VIRU|nr:Hypothetical protein ORPV_775 [Orpheovirus IHUMI-LCC2]SNW62679.1 Hypothetical protein ORPV_775 [Orpheovirus IHUMI-LCC2]